MNVYKIFCATENEYRYVKGSSLPTVCPENESHEVDLNKREVFIPDVGIKISLKQVGI